MLTNFVRPLTGVRLPLALLVLLGAVVLIAFAARPAAVAQEVNVEISELRCDTDPEVVVVVNKGNTPIDMTGWNLQSDPTSSESLALQQFGSLAAGEMLTAQAGPSAEGAFVWSQTEVFRNNDPSDFAQLASDAGQVLLKVNCAAAQQSGTPTAAAQQTARPTAAPAAASPTALGAVSAPTAGGPPEVATSITPFLLIIIGSGLSTAGLGAFFLGFGGGRRGASVPALPAPQLIETMSSSMPVASTSRRRAPADGSAVHLVLVGILVLLAALLLAFQPGERKRQK
jgi:hypothetical protein